MDVDAAPYEGASDVHDMNAIIAGASGYLLKQVRARDLAVQTRWRRYPPGLDPRLSRYRNQPMEFITIEVARREKKGTAASRKLRQTGQIPAVLYGLGRPARRSRRPAPRWDD